MWTWCLIILGVCISCNHGVLLFPGCLSRVIMESHNLSLLPGCLSHVIMESHCSLGVSTVTMQSHYFWWLLWYYCDNYVSFVFYNYVTGMLLYSGMIQHLPTIRVLNFQSKKRRRIRRRKIKGCKAQIFFSKVLWSIALFSLSLWYYLMASSWYDGILSSYAVIYNKQWFYTSVIYGWSNMW